MKIRNGFISNSSSTAFMITNLSDVEKTLVDFVKETPHIIEEFKKNYNWYEKDKNFTQENLIISAQENNIVFSPGKKEYCVFGDEDGTLIGQIYDYMLREEPCTDNFKVRFQEYLR